jgi:CheY-like chemotaxis protein
MPKTLLLADDSVTMQKVVGITFAREDVELVTVDNGDEALARAREVQPDVVLADVSMPGLNGYALCAELKRDPALQRVPVLLLTGTFEPFDEARAAEVGADSHISKPFEAQALVDQVRTLLERAAQPSPPLAPQAPEVAPQAPEVAPQTLGVALQAPEVRESPLEPVQTEGAGEPLAPSLPEPSTSDLPARSLKPTQPAAAAEPSPTPQPEPRAADPSPGGFDETRIFSPDMLPTESEPLEEAPPLELEEPALGTGDTAVTAPMEEQPLDRSLLSETSFLDPSRATGATGADTAPTPLLGEEEDEVRSSWDAPADALFGGGSESEAMRPPASDFDLPSPISRPSGPDAPPRPLEMTMVVPESHAELEPEPELEPLPEPIEPPSRAASAEAGAAQSGADEELPWLEPVPLEGDGAPEEAAHAAVQSGPAAAAVDPERLRDSLEKVAWEAFGPLSEQLVREVVKKVEEIAWEVIPQLTEQLIREEIARLKGETD